MIKKLCKIYKEGNVAIKESYITFFGIKVFTSKLVTTEIKKVASLGIDNTKTKILGFI